MRRVIFCLPILTLCVPGEALGEEGLFIAKMSVGVSAARAESASTDVGAMLIMGVDLGLTDRLGIINSISYLFHDDATTIGTGFGLKYNFVQGFWDRLYLRVTPQFLLIFPKGESVRADFAICAGLGYEHIVMWGLGLYFELEGTFPTQVGPGPRPYEVAFGGSSGAFLEF